MANRSSREWMTDGDQLRRLKLLEKVPLFAGLSRRQLGKLLVKLFEREYGAGEAIFSEGEPGKALFIVLKGNVSISHAADGVEKPLAMLGPGAYFGELALIDDQPRFATARADEDSVLLIFYRSHFDDLIEGHKTLAIRVMGNLLRALAGYVRGARPGSPKTGAVPSTEPNAMPGEKDRR